MKLENVIATRPSKTVYRDGNVIIKLFNEEFSTADVLNEALNHARIEETGLKVPQFEEVLKIDGKWAIVNEYIEGKTLAAILEENKDNPEIIDKYMDRFVDLQLEIQSKSSPLLTKLRDKMRRKIEQTGLDATTRYELNTRLESTPKHNKICHGDYNPSNVIITPDDEWYVIDWAHATQGNGGEDAARAYLLFTLTGKEELAKKYLNTYCKKSDTARQYVERWLPIVAASQLVKGNEHEKDLLMKWIDVVEYE